MSKIIVSKFEKLIEQELVPYIPKGIFKKCSNCQNNIYVNQLRDNNFICPICGDYFRVPSIMRLRQIIDEGSFKELFTEVTYKKEFIQAETLASYEAKINKERAATKLNEAIIVGKGKIKNKDVYIGICDSRFMMGSMGYVVGEKITLIFEKATSAHKPVIIICCSGGARMQEGIVSLMQMEKTAAAIKRHSDEGLLYISILTDPTMGGAAASFAMLGDIILSEPNALIGFAGPTVIANTINQELPAKFQSAESLVKNGFIDGIVDRRKIRDTLSKLLYLNRTEVYKKNKQNKISSSTYSVSNKKTAWEIVKTSRCSERPTSKDYIDEIFDDFTELLGDREGGEDKAVIGGIALIDNIPITVIGHQKGKDINEKIERNFGMASPEGYKKALRLMKQADKFKRPVVTFIDTPGAKCDIDAENHGQALSIAKNLFEMSSLKIPIISVLIGEGSSGGALGIAIANEVIALENATYSIISPEGYATILWKDVKKASKAAEQMCMTSYELMEMKIIESIIPEVKTLDNIYDINPCVKLIKGHILDFIYRKSKISYNDIVTERYKRFRNF